MIRSLLAHIARLSPVARRPVLEDALRSHGVTDEDVIVLTAVGLALVTAYTWPTGESIATSDESNRIGAALEVLDLPSVFDFTPAAPGNPEPVLPPPPPSTPAPPVNGSANGSDMIDLATVQIVNAPDVRAWPITSRITRIELEPNNVKIFTDPDVSGWPGVYPPGFADPIGFTVWCFKNVGGQWVASGFIEGVGAYHGADGVGDGVFDFPANWWYSSRWAPLFGQGVANGEILGFMLTGGDARDGKGPFTNQRTTIVTVPASSSGTFNF